MKHYEEQTEKDKKEKDNKEQQHMIIQQTDQMADDPESPLIMSGPLSP
jgi:hypothetical protein